MTIPKWVRCLCIGTVPDCVQCRMAKALAVSIEALEYVDHGRSHIGNDANGNVFGLPDLVMCRNRVKHALAEIEKMGESK